MTTLLDTGPLLAYLHKNEKHHEWAKRQFASLDAPFYTCEAVLCETYHLSRTLRNGLPVFFRFLQHADLRFTLSYDHHQTAILQNMKTYINLPMDFADACLVHMAALETDHQILTTDGDFLIYRIHRNVALNVILPSVL